MFYVEDSKDPYVLLAVLSSGLFYFHYSVFSDYRHVNIGDFGLFNFDYQILSSSNKNLLASLSRKLMGSYINNLEWRDCNYTGSIGECKVPFYRQGYSKEIIDGIDDVLARHYGFTDEELDFIINYDIKYRMGNVLFDEGEQQGDAEAEEAESFVEEQDEVPARAGHKQTAVKMELPLGFSAYHVYRCLLCNKLIPGFEAETHTAEVHGGEYPGYEKLGG